LLLIQFASDIEATDLSMAYVVVLATGLGAQAS